MTIQAIETRYAGCRFRSRLEARWAVFLTFLDVAWHYELQGYVTDAGPYLPDFLVQQEGLPDLWLEVRPPGTRGLEVFYAFLGFDDETGETTRHGFVLGDLPDPSRITTSFAMPHVGNSPWGAQPGEALCPSDGDAPYLWCTCWSGQHYDLQFEARGHRIPCPCNAKARADRLLHGDWGHMANHRPILEAFAAARSARFEHGENGGRL